MSGYRIKPRVRHIVFDEDTEFPGLDMRAHGLTVAEWQAPDSWTENFELFADKLIEWNLEGPDGAPIEPTMEGMAGIDVGALKAIVLTWVQHSTGVWRSPLDSMASLDSGEPDSGPDLDMEASIPMGAVDAVLSATAAG